MNFSTEQEDYPFLHTQTSKESNPEITGFMGEPL